MEEIMFKIPFSWMPGSWGLKGKTRDIADAEYELSGYSLDLRLLEIRKDELSNDEFDRLLLDMKLAHKKITEDEYSLAIANLIKDDTQRELALTEIDLRSGKLSKQEYEKKVATIKGEPWLHMVNMDFTKKSALEGSFELDWNQPFVDKLKSEGYTGPTPDNIVNQWFMELCRNIAMEEFDGTGNFAADSEANLDAVKRWSSDSESLGEGRKGYK
jgi:hypothetical protein